MNGDAYTDAPVPHCGDTACKGCGRVLDPVQTLHTVTGRCWYCDRAAAAALMKNRMVPG